MVEKECEDCQGKRFKPEALAVTVRGYSIDRIVEMSIAGVKKFLEKCLKPDVKPSTSGFGKIAQPIIKEIINRLQFLIDVGLDYITINRKADTLAGGEEQRIRLSTQIGSKLTGVLYILDEPTTGLHPDDIKKLIFVLKSLVEKGNTVLIIEHAMDIVRNTDWIIDLGPEGGDKGG